MELERSPDWLNIRLNHDDMTALKEGEHRSLQTGLTPESRIEVFPLSVLDNEALAARVMRVTRDPYIEGLRAKLTGELYSNGDLSLWVPDVALMDRRITYKSLESGRVGLHDWPEEYVSKARKMLPARGIKLVLATSLQSQKKLTDIDQDEQKEPERT